MSKEIKVQITKLAEQIARKTHGNQFRRDKTTPYITHVERVVKRLKGESEEILASAWLHDVLEDSSLEGKDLLEMGVPKEIVKIVECLTKPNSENYDDYIRRVCANKRALKVKRADIIDNLSDSPSDKQLMKYTKVVLIIMEESFKNLKKRR